MPVISNGGTATFTVANGDYIRVTTGPEGFATLEAVGSPGLASGERRWTRIAGRQVFGPWQAGTVRINALADAVEYEFGAQIATDDRDRPALWSDASCTALVRPDGSRVPFARNPLTLGYTPSLVGLQINAALVSSITAGPSVAANDAAEYTTLQGALTKGHVFSGGASGVANANRFLLSPGSTIRDNSGLGVRASGSARLNAGNPDWWNDGYFEVMTDAPDIAIVTRNQTTPMRWLEVDGVLVATDSLSFTAPASGNRWSWQRVVFPNAATRLLRFGADSLADIRCGPQYSIWKPPARPRMKVIGDSFAGNFYGPGGESQPYQSGGDQLMRIGNRISRVFGLAAPIQSTRGSTGFVAGTAGEYNYLGRIQLEEVDASVALVWFFGTGNDSGQPEATYRANVSGALNLTRAQYPNAAIVVSGVLDGFAGTAISNVLNPILADEVQRAGVGALFLPVGALQRTDDGYIYGTGRVGATTGNGNADVYLGTGTADRHWNNLGISYAALRYAQDIRDLFSR